jgi:hypothetical protein
VKAIAIRAVICTCFLALLSGCARNNPAASSASTKPFLGAAINTPSLFCWFVEDNGAGKSGYAAMDGQVGGAYPEGGGLFPTIEQVRDAIRHQQLKTPLIVPHYPGEVPESWKIRSLTTNEVDRLGLSYNCMWPRLWP